jgi:23S rRNA (cytosine1962-C5)-methyltransferase
MGEEKLEMFRNRLIKVNKHISKMAKRQQVSCFRIYDHDIPEFPFCMERYQDRICLAEYKRQHGMSEEAHADWLATCLSLISEILEINPDKIYLRQRQRKEGRYGQYEKISSEQEFFIVQEAGLKFKVNLTDYLDTGLFLDHRITRSLVREEAEGKEVLNLFAYTGSFSVYAAAGNAAGITSIDLSKTYLNWAEENFALNGFIDKKKYRFIQEDVKQYIDKLPPGFFDLVIMDPPTFSNSKRMKDFLDIQRDHVELLNKTLDLMKPGAAMYFSTNFRSFQLETGKINAKSIRDITKMTTAFDFQGKPGRYCYKLLK